jgi:hypothetical protein
MRQSHRTESPSRRLGVGLRENASSIAHTPSMPSTHQYSFASPTHGEIRDHRVRETTRRTTTHATLDDRTARSPHLWSGSAEQLWAAPTLALGVVIAVLALIVVAPSALPAQARTLEAPVYRWSAPIAVNGKRGDLPVIAYEPMLALLGRDRLLVGTNLRGPTASMPANPLTMWRLGGASIGRPDGTFTYVHPRAHIDNNGFVHLLWAEPERVPTSLRGLDWPPEPLKSIWTATYQRGHGWSAPETLYATTGDLDWSSDGMGGGFSVHSRVLGFAVMEWTDKFPSLVLLIWNGSTWRIEHVMDAGLQPSVASSDGMTIYLAYIAAARDRAHDSNSLFGRWSRDGGVSWSPPVLLQRGGDHRANAPQLHFIDGELNVIWRQTAATARLLLRHAVWRDGASALGAVEDLEIPTGVQAIASAMDNCGAVHLAYSHRDSAGAHVDHVVWLGHWSSINHLVSTRPQGDVTIGVANGQLGLIVFNGKPEADDSLPVQAMYVTATVCTAKRP